MGTRAIGRLSPLKLKSLASAGRYCDGGGLYLQINRSGARSWIFRYQLDGRVRDKALKISLPELLSVPRQRAGHAVLSIAVRIEK